MLLKMFVMGGPLLHCFWTLCSNFHVKRGGGGGGGGWALDTWWAPDTYTTVMTMRAIVNILTQRTT